VNNSILTKLNGQSKTFDFVRLIELKPKPRDKGMIEIPGPYYTSPLCDFVLRIMGFKGTMLKPGRSTKARNTPAEPEAGN
jgi:hypothetical protein